MAYLAFKKDDLKPYVVCNLVDSNGDAVDLSNAVGVRFIMKKSGESAKVDASGTIQSATNGQVVYAWSSGDTDTSGLYNFEFEVDWGNGVYQTFPSDGYGEIEIFDDLGGGA